MYKLVVSEFDGALIDSEEAISTSTVMEIDKVRKSGCLFCISTDRCLKEVLDYNRDFSFIDYIIACSGAYLYDVSKHKVLYKKSITSVVLKKILNLFSDYDIYGVLEDRRCLVKNIGDEKIYKLEIECPSKKILNDISSRLDELNLNINYFSKKIEKTYIVEIVMDSVDKCLMIEKICNLRKINLDEVIGIGVDDKDISMIEMVGYGVAMKNATSSLKKVSNKITSSNDDDGVRKILNQLFN